MMSAPIPRFCAAHNHPSARGGTPPEYAKRIVDGVLIETDVAVTLSDGVVIYLDLYRPVDDSIKAAPLIAWGPYGKHGHTQYSVNFPNADVDDREMSAFTAFEAPDPFYWVRHGYAVINVDPRGTWYSQGNATYLSAQEARDFAEVIGWAGTQNWSNGKVGLSGVSYLTSAQWQVAALNPPHLAAINPWEGWSDMYREVVRHGGIPETSFWDYLPGRWGHGLAQVEDLRAETQAREFSDNYWASKKADLAQIKVPAFVCASWSDQGLHTRGTLEGFAQISSPEKWLYVHGRKKWAHYYDARSMEMQRAFFDHFLLGKASELSDWPKVRYEVRERFGVGIEKRAQSWPIENTKCLPLFLSGQGLSVDEGAAQTLAYTPSDGERLTFDYTFAQSCDVVGPMALHLNASITQGTDMDIFVAIQKVDRTGNIVPFAYYAQFEDGPVALGWLRASHRELDEAASTDMRPVHTHARALPLSPGEPISVQIEIWPSGTHFAVGEKLRLVIAGSDIYTYPKPSVYARHEDLRNVGEQRIHVGENTQSKLLMPVLSTENVASN